MRSLGLTLAVVVAAAALSGCGKSQPSSTDTTAASAPAPEPTDAQKKAILASLPAPYNTADLADGESKFALCASCHTLTAGGPNMTGPNLHGVFGRHTHSVDKFSYSDAMKGADFTWDTAHLDKWITAPKEMLPGTKMTFVGLPDAQGRTDVIAYLMVETGYKP